MHARPPSSLLAFIAQVVPRKEAPEEISNDVVPAVSVTASSAKRCSGLPHAVCTKRRLSPYLSRPDHSTYVLIEEEKEALHNALSEIAQAPLRPWSHAKSLREDGFNLCVQVATP